MFNKIYKQKYILLDYYYYLEMEFKVLSYLIREANIQGEEKDH